MFVVVYTAMAVFMSKNCLFTILSHLYNKVKPFRENWLGCLSAEEDFSSESLPEFFEGEMVFPKTGQHRH